MKKYLDKVTVRGIIQVGACAGQELPILEKYTQNIMLIEAHPHLTNHLIAKFPKYVVIETALGNENSERDFYLASNGESSSLLKPYKHIIHHPTITFNDTMRVKE
jgi:hypothetical protein